MRLHAIVPLLAAAIAAGCAMPTTQELRDTVPTAAFEVAAPLKCLYSKAVEHASAYSLTEPPFTWFYNEDQARAWFRQPLTLVELRGTAMGTTYVKRQQTADARALGQADDLVAFLRSNPCTTR